MIVVEEDEVRREGGILDLYLCLKKHEVGLVFGRTNLLTGSAVLSFRIWFVRRTDTRKKKSVSRVKYSIKLVIDNSVFFLRRRSSSIVIEEGARGVVSLPFIFCDSS